MARTPHQPLSGAAYQSAAARLATRLPALLIAARRAAASVAPGAHGRRLVGQGDAFWQFRRYQAGDAAGLIDWRQSARRQTYYVRQNEWAAAQSVFLWLDSSPSMDYRSAFGAGESKAARGAILLLALAQLLARGGERVRLLDSEPGEPRTWGGPSTLESLARDLLRPRVASGPDRGLPPERPLPRGAALVWFGDFLGPAEEIVRRIAYYAEAGLNGHLLQILDPAEEDLPFTGRTRFHGLEGETPFLARRAEGLQAAYHQRLSAQRAALSDACRHCGWGFASHRTDHAPQHALLALHAALGEATPAWSAP